MTIEIWERTGPVGTPVEETLTNANFKSTGAQASLSEYVFYPVRRPANPPYFGLSFDKFIFAKVSGTHLTHKRPRWSISSPLTTQTSDKVRFLIQQTPTYALPSLTLNNASQADRDNFTLIPMTNATNPDSATTYNFEWAPDTTYYTDFLHMQLYVDDDAMFGNISPITIRFEIDEYES